MKAPKKRKVVIVGAGALGSHLILLARNWPVEVVVVDFDKVEAKNTQAQFHTTMGRGKNKAVAIQELMHGLFRQRLIAIPHCLQAGNAAAVLDEADLVIDCTDNYAARETIQNFCKKATPRFAHPCLHGCLSAAGDLARVIWTEHFTADKEGEEGQATCEDGQNLWFHVMAAAVLAQAAQKFLETGEKHSFQLTPSALIRLS